MSLSTTPRSPEDTLDRLDRSGLRGRGGGWFPVARKWRAVRAEGGTPVVIANGAEGEPGSVKDRHLLRTQAARVLDGLRIAARTLGADEAIVYLKGDAAAEAASIDAALAASPPVAPSMRVVRGDDSYVGGEETAVLEKLEGRRAWPRPKPPFPAAVGLHGRPTLVQNVETLALVPQAVADPDAFAASQTTLTSIWGHVERPGVREVRLGTPLRDVIALAGPLGDPVLVFPAGPSAPPLTHAALGTPLHPDALRDAGSGLGTAALLVICGEVCVISLARSVAGFFERESCAQCPPCSVGSARLAAIVRGVDEGSGRPADIGSMREAAGFMAMHGYCAHSRTAAQVVPATLTATPAEIERHLAEGSCGASRLRLDPFARDSPEQVAIEATLRG